MINYKYSFKDFTNKDLSTEPVEDFNDTIIKGTCFYIEGNGFSARFPTDMTGVVFDRCNLDNCIIPNGNVVKWNCCNNEVVD